MRKGQCSKGILHLELGVYVCAHVCTCMCMCTCAYMCVRMGVYMHPHMCLCMCMRACVCAGGGESSRASEFQAEQLLPSLRLGVTQEVGWGLGAAAFP